MSGKSRKKYSVFTKSLIDNYLKKGLPIPKYIDSFPCLCLAVGSGNLDWTKKLMDAGLSLEEVHPDTGKNAFWTAVCFLDTKMVEFLLEKGANPNHKDFQGNTVFEFLLSKFSKDETKAQQEILKLLIKYGFDTKFKRQNNVTYLQMALVSGREDIAKILIKNGVPLYSTVSISEHLKMPSVSALIREEVSKRTALECALEIPQYRLIEILIQH
jgi:ankyrin repeat protein